MNDDEAPPTPLPPAAQPPYPAHPAPQQHSEPAASAEDAAPAAGAGLGPLGLTLIGGAVAAVGLAIALPFLRRKAKPAPKSRARPAKRTKAGN